MLYFGFRTGTSNCFCSLVFQTWWTNDYVWNTKLLSCITNRTARVGFSKQSFLMDFEHFATSLGDMDTSDSSFSRTWNQALLLFFFIILLVFYRWHHLTTGVVRWCSFSNTLQLHSEDGQNILLNLHLGFVPPLVVSTWCTNLTLKNLCNWPASNSKFVFLQKHFTTLFAGINAFATPERKFGNLHLM